MQCRPGGPGCSNVETAVIIEALSYGCSGVQLAIMGPSLALAPLLLAGNDAQKKKYAGMLAAEPLIAVSSLCTVTRTFAVLLRDRTRRRLGRERSENAR